MKSKFKVNVLGVIFFKWKGWLRILNENMRTCKNFKIRQKIGKIYL